MPVSTDLVLALSRRPVATVDPLQFLGEAAEEIARTLGAAGAVLVVPARNWIRGSDSTATLVGEIQHRDGQGPLSAVVRTARPMATPDLTRVGPPALAAIANEVGLASSVAVPLSVENRLVAVLQVLGRADRPVAQADVDALGAALDVLGARLADLLEFARVRGIGAPAVPPATPRPIPIPTQAPPPLVENARVDRTEVLPVVSPSGDEPVAAPPGRTRRAPAPARSDDVRVGPPAPAPPVRVEHHVGPEPEPVASPEFVAVPLAEAAPELATEELGVVAAPAVRTPTAAHARHRRPS